MPGARTPSLRLARRSRRPRANGRRSALWLANRVSGMLLIRSYGAHNGPFTVHVRLKGEETGTAMNAIVVVGVEDTESLQCPLEHNILVVGDQTPLDIQHDPLSFLLQLPSANVSPAGGNAS
jgi:hypothetical protein